MIEMTELKEVEPFRNFWARSFVCGLEEADGKQYCIVDVVLPTGDIETRKVPSVSKAIIRIENHSTIESFDLTETHVGAGASMTCYYNPAFNPESKKGTGVLECQIKEWEL